MIQGTWFRALARGERGARVRVKGGCKEQFCSLGWLTARDYDIVVEVGTCSPSLGGSRRLINAPVVLELWEFCTRFLHSFRGKLFFRRWDVQILNRTFILRLYVFS